VKALAVVSIALLFAACGSMRTISANAQVQFSSHGGHIFVNIFDESGLFSSAKPGQTEGSFAFAGDLVADPENNTLTLNWLSLSCTMQPMVTLKGDASQLLVRLETTGGDDDINLANCPGDPSPISLVLSLNATVTQDAVGLVVSK
jgi:hypothetical protein